MIQSSHKAQTGEVQYRIDKPVYVDVEVPRAKFVDKQVEVPVGYDKVIEKLEEMLQIDPNNPRNAGTYMELGDIYYSKELYDKAAVMYKAVTKLDPLSFEAFKALKELELMRDSDSEDE